VLNSGTIKWKVPLGEDAQAAAEGAKDTGIFMAEHHGIIVTSTGLLFVAFRGDVRWQSACA
jgi:quinoprotein glucose dehydrogenase